MHSIYFIKLSFDNIHAKFVRYMHTDVLFSYKKGVCRISKYKVHVTLKEKLQYSSHLLKHLSHCSLSNVDSQIIHWQIYMNLNIIGEGEKKYTREKLKKSGLRRADMKNQQFQSNLTSRGGKW